ncbi:MAG: hypothetical protein L6R40_001325 [Gallowayella cf. fulva]|nr:MAG: hypothetical protein L6R40_001325 [Xanthomendoza cf. fulva]
MAFTEKIMAPLMPGSSGLESIGSVAASFARQAQEEGDVDFDRYKAESPRSTLIMNMFGQADHDDYVAFVRVETIKAQRKNSEPNSYAAIEKAVVKSEISGEECVAGMADCVPTSVLAYDLRGIVVRQYTAVPSLDIPHHMPPEYQAQLATITQDSIQRGVHGMAMNTVGLTDWLLQGSERFDTVQVHRFTDFCSVRFVPPLQPVDFLRYDYSRTVEENLVDGWTLHRYLDTSKARAF